MTPKSFDEFINEQTAQQQQPVVDWAKRLDDWKQELSGFYSRIESFLTVYRAQGKITLTRVKKKIHEEQLGPYEVESMLIQIGLSQIQLVPIGTVLIGAMGRVDMNGPRGTIRFILVDKNSSRPNISFRIVIQGHEPPPENPPAQPQNIQLSWKIATQPPSIKYIDLTQESFYEAMMAVVNG